MPTTPGIHKDCNLAQFDSDERAVIDTISKEWYVTNSGHPLHGKDDFQMVRLSFGFFEEKLQEFSG